MGIVVPQFDDQYTFTWVKKDTLKAEKLKGAKNVIVNPGAIGEDTEVEEEEVQEEKVEEEKKDTVMVEIDGEYVELPRLAMGDRI